MLEKRILTYINLNKQMVIPIVASIVALIVGVGCGYGIFRYVATGKYNEMMDAAQKEAEVLKEKKLLIMVK